MGRAGLSLSPAFTLVSCSAYSSALKMEATCSSEMSVDFQRTIRHYIPEFRTLFIPLFFTYVSERQKKQT
jgi:Kef-type K+ transport system membrane component KefB